MAELLIRAADGPSDIAALQRLFRAYGDHLAHGPLGAASICIPHYDREINSLPAPYLAVLLALANGAAAGCVALKALSRPGEQACEMKRLYVGEGHRGLGLGRKLILAALEHARHTGHTALYLDTVPAAMPEANRLYDSLGFQRVDRYNGNPVADVVFYRRAL